MPLVQGIALPRPIHAMLRSSKREFFALPLRTVWELLPKVLDQTQEIQGFHVHAVVLMSNHLHLLFTPLVGDGGRILTILAEILATEIRLKAGLPRSQFGLYPESYEIRHVIYFNRALKYVYRNPVNAGLCLRVEVYPYSTLGGTTAIRLHESYFGHVSLPREHDELLHWLNTPEEGATSAPPESPTCPNSRYRR